MHRRTPFACCSRPPRRNCTALLLAFALIATGANAEEKETPNGPELSAQVAIGAEYDSNVSVEEVDAATSESDHAFTLDLGVGLKQQLAQNTELGLSYD